MNNQLKTFLKIILGAFCLIGSTYMHAQIEISFEATPPSCKGYTNGVILTTVTGGAMPYSYSWSNGVTTAHLYGIVAGEYALTVTDANGTIKEASSILSEPSLLETTIQFDADVCLGVDNAISAVVTGGTQPYSYKWSNEATTSSISNLEAIAYYVTVTDANGCEAVAFQTVSAKMEVEVITQDVACADFCDGSARTEITGGTAPYRYIWNTGEETAFTGFLPAGDYQVSVVDANGCFVTASGTVGAPDALILSIDIDNACNVGSILDANVDISGGIPPYQFNWSDGGDGSNLERGQTYELTVTDANGCKISEMIDIPQEPSLVLFPDVTNAACSSGEGGSAIITTTGGTAPYSYVWSNGLTGNTVDGLDAGTYEVTATDATGCTGTTSVTVDSGDALRLFPSSVDATCSDVMDGMANILPEGGVQPYRYEWSDGQTLGTAMNLSPGLYTVTVTDAEGCTGEERVLVGAASEITITETVINAICDGSDGSIEIEVMGGTAPYTYTWESGETTTSLTNLTSGTYRVVVTDDNGCTATKAIVVENGEDGSVNITPDDLNIERPSCDDLRVNLSHELAGDYIWVIGDIDNPLAELTANEVTYTFDNAGTYDITLVPPVGLACANSATKSVELTPPATANFDIDFNDCESPVRVNFTDQSTEGAIAWDWAFSNGMTSNEQNPTLNLEESTTISASLVVTYAEGCEATIEKNTDVNVFSVNIPEMISACPGEERFLNPDFNEDYIYQWSPADILDDATVPNPSVIVDEPTTFRVEVIDPTSSCTSTREIQVNPTDEIAYNKPADLFACDDMETTLSIETDAGVKWYNDSALTDLEVEGNDLTVIPNAPKVYYVELTTPEGCSVIDSVMVGNYRPDIEVEQAKETSCAGEAVQFEVMNFVPEDVLTYNWTPGDASIIDDPTSDMPIVTPSESTTFTVNATNQFGCMVEQEVTLKVIDLESSVEIGADEDTIVQGASTQLYVTEGLGFDYNWEPATTLSNDDTATPFATPVETTTYKVTIIDENGCAVERSIQLTVLNGACDEPFIFFPNAFSPNGDGVNDVLCLRGYNIDESYFVIYNRWGEKVYESFSQDQCWDGSHQGEPVCADVYGYYLRVKCFNGDEFYKQGNVTVLK